MIKFLRSLSGPRRDSIPQTEDNEAMDIDESGAMDIDEELARMEKKSQQ